METKTDTKDVIINNLKIVTEGIIKDLRPNNSFSSWKNSPIGLNFIKNDTSKFYMGINLWIEITEKQLIGISDYRVLEEMKNIYPWLTNFLEIKNLVS